MASEHGMCQLLGGGRASRCNWDTLTRNRSQGFCVQVLTGVLTGGSQTRTVAWERLAQFSLVCNRKRRDWGRAGQKERRGEELDGLFYRVHHRQTTEQGDELTQQEAGGKPHAGSFHVGNAMKFQICLFSCVTGKIIAPSSYDKNGGFSRWAVEHTAIYSAKVAQ